MSSGMLKDPVNASYIDYSRILIQTQKKMQAFREERETYPVGVEAPPSK